MYLIDAQTMPLPRVVDDPPTTPIPRVADRPAKPLLWALVFVVLSFGVMQVMLVPSVGVLQREFNTTAAGVSWAVVSATLLASAVITPLVGRLGDRYGKRKVLLWSLSIYLVGTASAIIAPNLGVLIACRAVQGIGMALLPLTFAIVRESMPRNWIPFSLALTSGLVGGTAGAGLLVGGIVVDMLSWQWLFVVTSTLIIIALVLSTLFVPESPTKAEGGVDVGGTVTLAVGLVSVLLAITQASVLGLFSPLVLGLFALGIVVLGVFVWVERRLRHPVIDLKLLTYRPLLLTHLGAFALGVNQFVVYVLVPRLSQSPNGLPPEAAQLVTYGFAASVTGAALIILPGTLLVLPASWSATVVERRFGTAGPLVVGLVLSSLGAVLIGLGHAAVWQVILFNVVCSAGHGFAMAALPRLVNESSEPTQSASANGINTVARTVGGAVGTQIATGMLTSVTIAGTSFPAENAFTFAFLIAATIAGCGAGLVLFGRGSVRSAASKHSLAPSS